jgi:hypothetical protein
MKAFVESYRYHVNICSWIKEEVALAQAREEITVGMLEFFSPNQLLGKVCGVLSLFPNTLIHITSHGS